MSAQGGRPSARGGWLRRNALALAALGTLVVVAVVGIGGSSWWYYYESRPVFPHTISAGGSGTFGGADWQVAAVDDVTSQVTSPVPADGRVIRVTVDVSPGSAELTCSLIRLSALDGSGRQWVGDPPDVALPYDATASSFCDASEGDFRLALAFLVPRDLDGALALDVPVSGSTPAFLRLELPR